MLFSLEVQAESAKSQALMRFFSDLLRNAPLIHFVKGYQLHFLSF